MTDICTCNFSHYGVLLDSMPDDENPHRKGCPFSEPTFIHWDTTDWTPEDYYEASIDGFYCEHAEDAKDHLVKSCSICDPEGVDS